MPNDSKTIIIWILAIALIVVGVLWIKEKNKPNNVRSFSEQMTVLQAEVKVACADISTEDKRVDCIDALGNVSALLSDFFPVEKAAAN